MKKLIISFITLAALTLTACNDWLNVNPSTEVDSSQLFNSESGYADALTGVYSKMTSTSLYGRNLTWYMLDEMAGCYSSVGWGTNYEIAEYPYKHSNESRDDDIITMVDSIWSGMYNQVANLNSLLSTIDGNKSVFSSEDNYKIIKGEALGLRAYLHFDLLRMFAKPYSIGKDSLCIPYVTVLGKKVTALSTEDEVLTDIINDLKEAKELMVNDPIVIGSTPASCLASTPSDSYYKYYNIAIYHNRRLHFNYYAVLATLARAYLWKGDKTDALAAAKEVIAAQSDRFPWVTNENLSAINSSSSDTKNRDRSFVTEQIFALNILKTTMQNDMDGYIYFGTSSDALYDLQVDQSVYEGHTTDPRYMYWTTTNGTYGTLLTKFYQNDACYDYFQQRLPLIRISEMYYIAAECAPTVAEGVAYLENVRSQRGLSASPLSTTMTADELSSDIETEYRKELVGEGQMWFYYKRHLAAEIPNMSNFNSIDLYTFDRPEDEDTYGGR
jgi:starch-binding outer membrane protein, SusD/RagB family